ncbi:MAG TPA: patatin-like phospholipase family protein [Campylobacterales bacterium]|nr:patatin-like phospholipase family protein [Campylobacterales bacterium]
MDTMPTKRLSRIATMRKILLTLLFLLLPSSILAEESYQDTQKDFSLIISGGISLGAYEAGYNWALMRQLNHLKHNSSKTIKMHSIAGASAGAINSVMSAMAWCRSKEMANQQNLIENNLFYRMWTAIDFEDLFIDNQFGTTDADNTTSLFSRNKIELLSEEIFKELDAPYFEPECSIPFGFAVTRVEPKISKIQSIEIANKLFHIPLTLHIGNNKKAKIYDNTSLKRDNIIHLSHNGTPSNERVKKALFASSAFPIAFEEVELEYFHRGVFEKALFLDGGVFDNVPLDFARRLSSQQAEDYIFIDPKHLRRQLPKKNIRTKKHTASPVNSAIKLIGDIFSSSESSILYNTLAGEFKDKNKKIEISSRYFPITGMFLDHFGAFLDRGFREYDYYIGVYDSIVDGAKYTCNNVQKSERCQQLIRLKNYRLLSKKSNRAKYILNLLSSEEFGYPFESKTYTVEPDLLAIFNAIKSLNYQDIEEFYSFIENLNHEKYQAKNSYLKHTLAHPNEWYKQPFSSIMHRIVSLEKKNSGNLSKALSSITAYGIGALYKTKSGYQYNPISAPLDYDKFWVKTLPYELAFSKNLISLGYENYYYLDKESLLIPRAFEIKPSLSFILNDVDDQVDFFRCDFNLNYELKKDLITLGFGASAFQDLSNSIDSHVGFGSNIYLDFLDILRISYVKRDNYQGKDDFIYFGINDIPSFIYWMSD